MLEVRKIKKSYGSFLAVDELDFNAEDGEVVAIAGENGAGKSTSLKILAGVMLPDSGKVLLDSYPVSEIKKKIGYLPEFDALYDNMTSKEYLQFFASLYDVREKRIVKELLEEFEVPEKLCSELSKGNKRKLSIARTLIHDPKLLVYDEPLSGLDPVMALKIAEKIRELANSGKIVIFSTHNLYYVERVADKIVIMKRGRVLYYGPVKKIMKKSNYLISFSENGMVKRVEVSGVDELLKEISKLQRDGFEIIDIGKTAPRLEDVYFELLSST